MATLFSQEEKLAQAREIPHMSRMPFKMESPAIGDDLIVGHTTGLPEGEYSWWGNRSDDWSLLAASRGVGGGYLFVGRSSVAPRRTGADFTRPSAPVPLQAMGAVVGALSDGRGAKRGPFLE